MTADVEWSRGLEVGEFDFLSERLREVPALGAEKFRQFLPVIHLAESARQLRCREKVDLHRIAEIDEAIGAVAREFPGHQISAVGPAPRHLRKKDQQAILANHGDLFLGRETGDAEKQSEERSE